MVKRRARKIRPAPRGQETSARESAHGAGPASATRQAESDRRDNLRRFTLSGWAVVAQVLRQRTDRTAILDLLGFYDWLGDSNLELIKRTLPPLPCRAGCAYCCYVGPDRPDLLPAELLRIVSFLRDAARAATLAEVQARLQAAPQPSPGSDPAEKGKESCFFLHQEQCAVYPVRPMRCRAQHSPDRDACERYVLGRQDTMPLLREPALLYKSLEVGMRMGLHEAGLQEARLAMDGALRIALLEQPEALERWLDGQPVFEGVAFPDPADEEQFLAQLRQQSRGQVRAEARRLHTIIASILEQPGTWALYSTTGQAPSNL